MDRFYWRAVDIVAYRDFPGGKVSTKQIYHLGMHHALVARFGGSLEGRPHFTLLSEAIASCLDLYFFAASVRSGKQNSQSGVELLEVYKLQTEVARGALRANHAKNLTAVITEAARSPFEVYKKAVDQMFNRYLVLSEVNERRRAGEKVDLRALHDRLERSKWAPVLGLYDFPGNLLYVDDFCGRKSTAEDRRLVAQCRKMLDESSSLDEFLVGLEVSRNFLKKAA